MEQNILQIDEQANQINIYIQGAITIEKAAELHGALMDFLKDLDKRTQTPTLQLQLPELEKADSSFFQILMAFCRSLRKRKIDFCLSQESCYRPILDSIKLGGFFKQFQCIENRDHLCLFNSLHPGEEE